jgi:23S rRNA (cytidine1920-2'-O)/16S rRNA (cytidine1409-2'-O)-methyltransferase
VAVSRIASSDPVHAARRMRLDTALTARGLVPSRSRARDLIVRGLVQVDGVTADKAGLLVAAEQNLVVSAIDAKDVSRGAVKLRAALAAFALPVVGRIALDLGASTGGFTDVLLSEGARKVYAVDVGHGQLSAALRQDPRVVSLEGQDVRQLDRHTIPDCVDAVTADLSFISLTKALPAALTLAKPGAWLIALIKPQFELGRQAIGKRGIVRSEVRAEAAVEQVAHWLHAAGWSIIATMPSPITGGSGNREFLLGAALKEA